MKRAALALVVWAALIPATAAHSALNAYRTGITLPQAIKLGDGSVLPAGKYDVQIDYKGFGNAAEFHFFQGGMFKGKAPAEARGFPTHLARPSEQAGHIPKMDVPDVGLDKSAPGGEAAAKNFDKVEPVGKEKWAPPADPASFSWGKAGFPEGRKGVVTKGPPGMLKLSFDSTNSAAGFNAILPYVENPTKR